MVNSHWESKTARLRTSTFVLNVCDMQAKSLSMDLVVYKSGLSPVHPILLTVFSCYIKLYIFKGQNL